MQILASQPSDYSYFNNIVMRTLVAPSDWKAVSSLTGTLLLWTLIYLMLTNGW